MLKQRLPGLLLTLTIVVVAVCVVLVSAVAAPAACLTPAAAAAMTAAHATPVAPATAQAAATPLPGVTISPLSGTPDASPATQISFLGVAPADLSGVLVRGSCSGTHRGHLKPYATGTGASFLPLRAFTPGETVSVSATLSASGRQATIGTSFKVGLLYTIPLPPVSRTVAAAFTPPPVTTTVPAANPALGDVFLTPEGAWRGGAMILSPAGQLVWFSASPPGFQAEDLRVQHYLGQPVLTYWQGRIAYGHGAAGEGIIDNTGYQPIAKVQAGNGLAMDLHEFVLKPDGIAWITVYEPVHWDLRSGGGPDNGIIEDCVVQEIDVRTGLVMFEWHALGHVPLNASYGMPSSSPSALWDWFHINSIDVAASGNILISSRNTWTVYEIDHHSGAILWQLGGHSSSFTLGPGLSFAWQHDATWKADGSITIFDNEDTPQHAAHSRAIDVGLNFGTHVATLLHTYTDPQQPVLTPSEGDIQPLVNGDQMIDWGDVGLVSEISAAGALTLQMELPKSVTSYRGFRFPWQATPASKPLVVAKRAATATTTAITASWNGATAVAAWQVLAGASRSTLTALGAPVPRSDFETPLTAATTAPYVAVSALGASGAVLATSAAVAVTP